MARAIYHDELLLNAIYSTLARLSSTASLGFKDLVQLPHVLRFRPKDIQEPFLPPWTG